MPGRLELKVSAAINQPNVKVAIQRFRSLRSVNVKKRDGETSVGQVGS